MLVGAMRSILTVNHHTIHKEISVATTRWQTTFDLIGLGAYFTLMTGEMPDGKLLREARKETGPSAEVVLSGPKGAERRAIGSSTG